MRTNLFSHHVCKVNRRHFIGLGSNLGNRAQLLDKAIQAMQDLWGIAPQCSSRYNTPAWGMAEGTPDFLNQVVLLSWNAPPDPDSIMQSLLDIEKDLGRERIGDAVGYDSRTMDLDLLAIDGLVWTSSQLTLPHPRMHLRRFVLLPMAELAGDARPDPEGPTVNDLLRACPDVSSVQLYPTPVR
jgi:2-amino-4-hydroxy-6-hydroxymethyldihydropteridine diphosphokinase